MGSDIGAVVEASRTIAQRLRRCGFGCRVETLNAVAAWLGSLPGQQHKDIRQSTITTQNLTHMMPLSQPFMGHEYNPSPYFPPESPPLFYGVTAGGACGGSKDAASSSKGSASGPTASIGPSSTSSMSALSATGAVIGPV